MLRPTPLDPRCVRQRQRVALSLRRPYPSGAEAENEFATLERTPTPSHRSVSRRRTSWKTASTSCSTSTTKLRPEPPSGPHRLPAGIDGNGRDGRRDRHHGVPWRGSTRARDLSGIPACRACAKRYGFTAERFGQATSFPKPPAPRRARLDVARHTTVSRGRWGHPVPFGVPRVQCNPVPRMREEPQGLLTRGFFLASGGGLRSRALGD
jgi:hypothetical protein